VSGIIANQESTGPAGSLRQLHPLPKNWRWARLKDVCTKVQDGTHFSPKDQSRTGDFKYITAKNIKHWGLDLSNVTYLPESVHREIYKRCNPEKGDVLYIKDGVTTGVATVNSLDEEFSLLSSVALLKPRRDVLDPRFLTYYLNSSDGYRVMTGQMTGTAIKRLILQKIKESFVPVAPLDEQHQIVAEIEKQFTRLQAGVAGLRRVQANLKRYRAAVLKAACEGKLVPTEAELARQEGRSYETGDQLLERILTERREKWQGRGSFVEPAAPEATALPKLPEDWTWAAVEQLSTVVRGASPRPAGDPRYFGGNIPWITVGPLTADNSPYLKSVPASLNELGREHSRYIEPQTLLLTNSGATLGVPKITLIGGCINDGVAALLDVGYPLKLYLLYFLRTQTERLRGVNQGAAQPNLNTTIIKALSVPLPPVAEQTRIVAEVERRLSVVEELEAVVNANLQRATRLRQSILQRALNGELWGPCI
jgi:type I restriction enzyme, S subunit